MTIICFICAVLAAANGWRIDSASENVFQQILAYIMYLMSAVLFAGAVVSNAVNRLRKAP